MPSGSLQDQWLQVNLAGTRKVTGIVIQGCPNQNNWVNTLKLQYSGDGDTWTDYTDYGQVRPLVLVPVLVQVLHQEVGETHIQCVFQVQALIGSTDRNTQNTWLLEPPVSAQYVRVLPLEANGQAGLRLEVLGCSPDCKRPC